MAGSLPSSAASFAICKRAECVFARESAVELAQILFSVSDQANEFITATRECDQLKELVAEKELYVASLADAKCSLEKDANKSRLDQQTTEAIQLQLENTISTLNDRAKQTELYEAEKNQFEGKCLQLASELKLMEKSMTEIRDKYKTSVEGWRDDVKSWSKQEDKLKRDLKNYMNKLAKSESMVATLKARTGPPVQSSWRLLAEFGKRLIENDLMTSSLTWSLRKVIERECAIGRPDEKETETEQKAALLRDLNALLLSGAHSKRKSHSGVSTKNFGKIGNKPQTSAQQVQNAHASVIRKLGSGSDKRKKAGEDKRKKAGEDDSDYEQTVCQCASRPSFALQLFSELQGEPIPKLPVFKMRRKRPLPKIHNDDAAEVTAKVSKRDRPVPCQRINLVESINKHLSALGNIAYGYVFLPSEEGRQMKKREQFGISERALLTKWQSGLLTADQRSDCLEPLLLRLSQTCQKLNDPSFRDDVSRTSCLNTLSLAPVLSKMLGMSWTKRMTELLEKTVENILQTLTELRKKEAPLCPFDLIALHSLQSFLQPLHIMLK